MSKLRFEDLPKAMETVLEKLSFLEAELKSIKENFQPKEPMELGIGNRVYYKRSEIEKNLIKMN